MHLVPKALGPIIQVLLIAELAVLTSRKTPFDAAILPPLAYHFSSLRKSHELHAVLPTTCGLIVFRGVRMIRDQHLLTRRLKLPEEWGRILPEPEVCVNVGHAAGAVLCLDRKSTRLNSSHSQISYAVFCLKKKKKIKKEINANNENHINRKSG